MAARKPTTRTAKVFRTSKVVRKKSFLALRPGHIILGTLGWWLLFLGLRSLQSVPQLVVNVVGFSFLAIVPGALTIMCLRLGKLVAWGKLVLAIALSLLEIILVGLLTNTVLQWAGVKHPLSEPYLILSLSGLLGVLLILVKQRSGKWVLLPRRRLKQIFPTKLDVVLSFGPILFVALSVLGATALNNGAAPVWTVIMLLLMGAYSVVLILLSKQVATNTIPTALFFMALSLLLMTSLRGWYITGHDVQREFSVFELTNSNSVWKIQSFRDPYNACLSITILPTILAKMLHLSDPYMYKVYFQMLFATVPPIIYLLVRKWASTAFAFAATLYFIAFPTFFTDMPMLNRQEIAFIYFALMIFIMFQDEIALKLRRNLFLALSAGLILSHYSTTYSVIVIMLTAVVVWPAIVWLGRRLRRKSFFKQSSLTTLHSSKRETKRITIGMVGIIMLGSFLWTTILTNTGNNTARVIKETAVAVVHSFKEEGPKASETSYNLFSFTSVSPEERLDSYAKTVASQRVEAPGDYYPVSAADTPVSVAPPQLALTPSGRLLQRLGISVNTLNSIFRQGWAKILQVLMLVGFGYMLLRRGYTRFIDTDYLALAFGCIVFVVLQVALPVLSVEYGLLRAFQQSLLILSIFVVLGSLVLFQPIRNKTLKVLAPTMLAVAFFLSSTGVFTQALGAYEAQIHLNNSGPYYDAYYQHRSDVLSTDWLKGTIQSASVQSAATHQPPPSDTIQADTSAQLFALTSIYPGLVRRDAYVQLRYTNVVKQQAIVFFDGDTVVYTYPLHFLDANKNLIYNNGTSRVYR